MQSNGTFRKAVDSIISFAKDTYRNILSREESKTIKSVMEAFGKDKEDTGLSELSSCSRQRKRKVYPIASTARSPVRWMMLPSVDMSRLRSVETQ